MLENGWIKLHRSLLSWEWYDDVPTYRLFTHLLLTVSIADDEWHGVHIPRGSRLTSLNKLSEETGLTIQQTRTALNHLQATHEITKRSTSQYTLISVVNYDSFQGNQQSNQQNNQQSYNKQPNKQLTNDQQTTNNSIRNKELKNIRIVERVDAREKFCQAIELEFGKLTGKLVSSSDARLIYQLYDDCTDTDLIINAMQIAAKTYKPKYNGDKIYSFKFFLTAINEAIAKKDGGDNINGKIYTKNQYSAGISNKFSVPEEELI